MGDKYYINENHELHREDGPAIECADGTKYWYLNGKRHREDGPAVELCSGSKHWYLNGENLSEEDFNQRVKWTPVLSNLVRKEESTVTYNVHYDRFYVEVFPKCQWHLKNGYNIIDGYSGKLMNNHVTLAEADRECAMMNNTHDYIKFKEATYIEELASSTVKTQPLDINIYDGEPELDVLGILESFKK